MTESEIASTVAMINLDTVLVGDNMYTYGGLGEGNWVNDQALSLSKDLGLDVDRDVDPWLVNANGDEIGRNRGENENFFPEYYVIPVDNDLQKNPLAAYEMAEYFIKNIGN